MTRMPVQVSRWGRWLLEVAAGGMLGTVLTITAYAVTPLGDSRPSRAPATAPPAPAETEPAICRERAPAEPLYEAFPLCP